MPSRRRSRRLFEGASTRPVCGLHISAQFAWCSCIFVAFKFELAHTADHDNALGFLQPTKRSVSSRPIQPWPTSLHTSRLQQRVEHQAQVADPARVNGMTGSSRPVRVVGHLGPGLVGIQGLILVSQSRIQAVLSASATLCIRLSCIHFVARSASACCACWRRPAPVRRKRCKTHRSPPAARWSGLQPRRAHHGWQATVLRRRSRAFQGHSALNDTISRSSTTVCYRVSVSPGS